MYEASGTIKLINETQSFASGFTKREFVITTAADKYPQDLKFQVVKERCAILDEYEVGQQVQVSFDLRGNEYNGKYYVDLSCWKLQASDGSSPAPSSSSSPGSAKSKSSAEPAMSDLRDEDDFDDDVPF